MSALVTHFEMTVQLFQIEKIQRYCQTKKRPESVLAAFELSFAPCPTSSSITSQFAGDHQSIACFEQPEDHIYDPNTRNITKYSFWTTPINIQKSRVANKHANHFCCLIFCIGSFWALRYSSVRAEAGYARWAQRHFFVQQKMRHGQFFTKCNNRENHTFWRNLFGSCYLLLLLLGGLSSLTACSTSSMTARISHLHVVLFLVWSPTGCFQWFRFFFAANPSLFWIWWFNKKWVFLAFSTRNWNSSKGRFRGVQSTSTPKWPRILCCSAACFFSLVKFEAGTSEHWKHPINQWINQIYLFTYQYLAIYLWLSLHISKPIFQSTKLSQSTACNVGSFDSKPHDESATAAV